MNKPGEFLQAVARVRELVETSDTPRESALLALGGAYATALRAGWEHAELRALLISGVVPSSTRKPTGEEPPCDTGSG